MLFDLINSLSTINKKKKMIQKKVFLGIYLGQDVPAKPETHHSFFVCLKKTNDVFT